MSEVSRRQFIASVAALPFLPEVFAQPISEVEEIRAHCLNEIAKRKMIVSPDAVEVFVQDVVDVLQCAYTRLANNPKPYCTPVECKASILGQVGEYLDCEICQQKGDEKGMHQCLTQYEVV